MSSAPEIVTRPEQPYVAIRTQVTMADLGTVVPPLNQDWAAEQSLTWDVTPSESGDRWGCRLENYLTDPSQEPDMSKWVTQLAFRLAD
jgi:hypothetical protein